MKNWLGKTNNREALVIGAKLILIGGCEGYEEIECINHYQACQMASSFVIDF
jgi:hypothetical protein